MAVPEICFLFNAYSDSGKSTRLESQLREKVKKQWPEAEFILTQPENHFWSGLRKQLKGTSTIVACGGDGTVHKAGNLAIELSTTLGIIPIGSGNDFAHILNIPKSVSGAFDHLKQIQRRKVDVIKIEGDVECFCLNTVGVGLDGLANYYTNMYKKRVGKAGYLAGAIKAIFENESFEYSISIDGQRQSEKLTMITSCNGRREGGNFWVAPDADPNDGFMDILMLQPMSTPRLLMALPIFMLSGSETFIRSERRRCKELEIECSQPVYIHIDGEYSEKKIRRVTLSIQKSALQVIA